MSGHIAPVRIYYAVFFALIVGTVLTYLAALVDFGFLNNIVMLAIALTKAALVILFFMGVRWSSRLTWVVAASGFVWLLILFGITMSDYMSRGWMVGSFSVVQVQGSGGSLKNPEPSLNPCQPSPPPLAALP